MFTINISNKIAKKKEKINDEVKFFQDDSKLTLKPFFFWRRGWVGSDGATTTRK